jgi:hypothetical protein
MKVETKVRKPGVQSKTKELDLPKNPSAKDIANALIKDTGDTLNYFSRLEEEAMYSIISKGKTKRGAKDFVYDIKNGLSASLKNASEDGAVPIDMLKDAILDCTTVINRHKRIDPEFYVKAVKFLSLRDLGYTILDAWSITFPERRLRMEKDNMDIEVIKMSAVAFANGSILTTLRKLKAVPIRVAFMDVKARAVGKLVKLMEESDSEKIQMDSADKLLIHLVDPEEDKYTEAEQVNDMEDKEHKNKLLDTLRDVVEVQRAAMIAGVPIAQVQNIHKSKPIDIEIEEEDNIDE